MLGIGRRPAVSEHQELVPRSERLVNHVGRALNRLDVRTVGNRGHVRRDLQKQLREFWSHGATTSITLLKFPCPCPNLRLVYPRTVSAATAHSLSARRFRHRRRAAGAWRRPRRARKRTRRRYREAGKS